MNDLSAACALDGALGVVAREHAARSDGQALVLVGQPEHDPEQERIEIPPFLRRQAN